MNVLSEVERVVSFYCILPNLLLINSYSIVFRIYNNHKVWCNLLLINSLSIIFQSGILG